MLHVALAGCAHIHTPNFIKRVLERRDLKVVMVWDHDAQRARKSASELNARIAADPKEIWTDAEIKAVAIYSETDRHRDLVLSAAEAGKHLFVEKPLGLGSADAFEMAAAIEKSGVLFQTGYFMRGSPVHLFLREELGKKRFGKVTRIRHSTCHAGSLRGIFDTEWRWMADLRHAGCGGFGDLGTHSLDILMWLMGGVEAVCAATDPGTARYPGCDELGEGLLRFRNGAIGSLAASWVDIAHPVGLILTGTEGHAHTADGQLFYKSQHVPEAESGDGKRPWTKLPEAWPHALELFFDAAAGKPNVPLVSAREAAARSSVMEALYESARARKWIEPKNP